MTDTVARLHIVLAEAEDLPVGSPQAFDGAYQKHQLPGGMVGTMPPPWRTAPVALRRTGDRGDWPRPRRAGLADRDDALRTDGDDAGGDERHRQGTL